jgi:hypothetical protein
LPKERNNRMDMYESVVLKKGDLQSIGTQFNCYYMADLNFYDLQALSV